jgi:hypothetical protein
VTGVCAFGLCVRRQGSKYERRQVPRSQATLAELGENNDTEDRSDRGDSGSDGWVEWRGIKSDV